MRVDHFLLALYLFRSFFFFFLFFFILNIFFCFFYDFFFVSFLLFFFPCLLFLSIHHPAPLVSTHNWTRRRLHDEEKCRKKDDSVHHRENGRKCKDIPECLHHWRRTECQHGRAQHTRGSSLNGWVAVGVERKADCFFDQRGVSSGLDVPHCDVGSRINDHTETHHAGYDPQVIQSDETKTEGHCCHH